MCGAIYQLSNIVVIFELLTDCHHRVYCLTSHSYFSSHFTDVGIYRCFAFGFFYGIKTHAAINVVGKIIVKLSKYLRIKHDFLKWK